MTDTVGGMISDQDARALRHWADFGLVYPPSPSFDPCSPTPGHEASAPQFRVGANVRLILHVERVIGAARRIATNEAEAAEREARAQAQREVRKVRLPLSDETGDQEAELAGRRPRAAACGLRAILALVYGPIRGHAELERVLATCMAEQLRADAERYYSRAAADAGPLPAAKPRPSVVERQRAQVSHALAQTMSELKRLVRQLGLDGRSEEGSPPV